MSKSVLTDGDGPAPILCNREELLAAGRQNHSVVRMPLLSKYARGELGYSVGPDGDGRTPLLGELDGGMLAGTMVPTSDGCDVIPLWQVVENEIVHWQMAYEAGVHVSPEAWYFYRNGLVDTSDHASVVVSHMGSQTTYILENGLEREDIVAVSLDDIATTREELGLPRGSKIPAAEVHARAQHFAITDGPSTVMTNDQRKVIRKRRRERMTREDRKLSWVSRQRGKHDRVSSRMDAATERASGVSGSPVPVSGENKGYRL